MIVVFEQLLQGRRTAEMLNEQTKPFNMRTHAPFFVRIKRDMKEGGAAKNNLELQQVDAEAARGPSSSIH